MNSYRLTAARAEDAGAEADECLSGDGCCFDMRAAARTAGDFSVAHADYYRCIVAAIGAATVIASGGITGHECRCRDAIRQPPLEKTWAAREKRRDIIYPCALAPRLPLLSITDVMPIYATRGECESRRRRRWRALHCVAFPGATPAALHTRTPVSMPMAFERMLTEKFTALDLSRPLPYASTIQMLTDQATSIYFHAEQTCRVYKLR